MTLATDAAAALAAAEAEQQAEQQAERDRLEADSRAFLADLFAVGGTPYDTAGLTTVDVDLTAGLVLLGDATAKVAVTDATTARFAYEDAGGAWTWTGGPLGSLADLGRRIEEHTPPVPPAPGWVQPTGAHDAYPLGARVTWAGTVWESTVDSNVWEPGVSGWREVTS